MDASRSAALTVLLALSLAACNPATAATPPTIHLGATPTEFRLPFNDQNVESEYCQGRAPSLPASEAQGKSEDEIIREVVERWLGYFNQPQAPDWCRIAGHRIDEVYYDAHALEPPVEPQGDIMRVVRFSVRLVQVPNQWMSLGGDVDPQNWLHTVRSVAVFRSDEGYRMQFATP